MSRHLRLHKDIGVVMINPRNKQPCYRAPAIAPQLVWIRPNRQSMQVWDKKEMLPTLVSTHLTPTLHGTQVVAQSHAAGRLDAGNNTLHNLMPLTEIPL